MVWSFIFSLSEWSLCHGDGKAAHSIWKPNVCNQGQCCQSGSANPGKNLQSFLSGATAAGSCSVKQWMPSQGPPYLPSNGRQNSGLVLAFIICSDKDDQGHKTWQQSEYYFLVQLLSVGNLSGGADQEPFHSKWSEQEVWVCSEAWQTAPDTYRLSLNICKTNERMIVRYQKGVIWGDLPVLNFYILFWKLQSIYRVLQS